jgi:outer membrane protein assembly factor BamB
MHSRCLGILVLGVALAGTTAPAGAPHSNDSAAAVSRLKALAGTWDATEKGNPQYAEGTPQDAALNGGISVVAKHLWCVIVAALLTDSVSPGARDWPQWRGVNRDGVSAETGLLQQWPPAGPRQLWMRQDVGAGFSAPAAVGDRLYLLANDDLESEFIRALSAVDGHTIWSVRLGRVGPNQSLPRPAARSTPTVVGEWIYALGSDGDLVCLARDDGRVRWRANLRTHFNGRPGTWAYAESPRVEHGRVVVTPGGAATMVAVNATTGEVQWTSEVPGAGNAAYSSISLASVAGRGVYVQFVESALIGVDAATGAFLWRYDKANRQRAKIATPVTRGDLVYTASAPVGGALLKLEADAAGITAREIYHMRGLPNSIGGSVLVHGTLYGTTDDGLVAVNFETGEMKWRHESIGPASVLYADGRLYLHGENGDVALVAASPDAYREFGRFTPATRPLVRGDQAWVYPVVSGGRLFIREHGTLWAFDVLKRG